MDIRKEYKKFRKEEELQHTKKLLEKEKEQKILQQEYDLFFMVAVLCKNKKIQNPKGIFKNKCPYCNNKLGKRTIKPEKEILSILIKTCTECDYKWGESFLSQKIRDEIRFGIRIYPTI